MVDEIILYYYNMGISQSKDKPLNENLLLNSLLTDILKRLEIIEDKLWIIDEKLERINPKSKQKVSVYSNQ